MTTRDGAIAAAREAAKGLSHSDREGLAMELGAVAAGEEVEFLQCSKGTLTAWLDRPDCPIKPSARLSSGPTVRAGLRLSDEDAAKIRGLGLDPAEVAKHMPERRPKRKAGPAPLSTADREAIRRLGHDPEAVEIAMGSANAADYRRRMAEAGR